MKSCSFSLPLIRGATIPGPAAFLALAVLALAAIPPAAIAEGQPPNILILMGDDIGWFNLSIYNHGTMGYRTPNLDQLAREGGLFTDMYAEQSCTAGRAAFITGQHGLRTGMTKVGLPGVPFGLKHEDPTIAEMLKPYGYTTGQFGKNHLGDANDNLPTTHGFDEFLGNLYHLNAEQEPEHPDYPGYPDFEDDLGDPDNPSFHELFGPRGVMHSYAKGVDHPDLEGTEIDQFGDQYGPAKGQYIVDTGPLTIQRMKTIDGVVTREAIRFMAEAQGRNQPFFTWWNSTRMHIWTHLKEADGYEPGDEVPAFDQLCYNAGTYTQAELCNAGQDEEYFAEGMTGLGIHPDGMVEHDMYIGLLLDFLKEKELVDNTIVVYTSDNGAETFTWPDGATTPFRSEKATGWEGGYRVPLLIRWPGVIKAGFVSNAIISLLDLAPTLVSAASEAYGDHIDIKAELMKTDDDGNPLGYELNGKTYKVHLDGYDFLTYFRCSNGFGPSGPVVPLCVKPRREFIYANDDGIITGIRYDQWKVTYHEQRQIGGLNVWQEPFTRLRLAKIVNLRTDPFEKADYEASDYDHWRLNHTFLLTPAQIGTYKFLQTFQKFPPRQAPPSFSIDIDINDIIEKCGTPGESPDDANCFSPEDTSKRLPASGGG